MGEVWGRGGGVATTRLDELRAGELEEARVRLRGARARHQRLAGARRPVHQAALRRLDADVVEALLVRHRQHDRLDELLDLVVEAADVVELLGRLLVDLHRLDARVELLGELLEDEVRVLVHADQVGRLHLLRRDEAGHRQEDRLPRRRLDHAALPLAVRVEVDVPAVLLGLVVRVLLEQLDHVGDEVRQLLVQLDLLGVLLDPLLVRLLVVLQPHRLVLEHLDLVLEHPRPLRNLVRARAGDFLPQIVVRARVAEDVDVHARSVRRVGGGRRGVGRGGGSAFIRHRRVGWGVSHC